MKHIFTLLLLVSISMAFALPEYYPLTSIAEDFAANWCAGCQNVFVGLDVLHSQMHAGEFISTRLYTESGPLTNQDVMDRFDHYEVYTVPCVIINGKSRIDGSDDQSYTGQVYLESMKSYRFGASPLKMEIATFDPISGGVSVNVQMISPSLNLDNASLYLYLLEDELSATDTRVVRQIIQHPISLAGAGDEVLIQEVFGIKPEFVTSKLWAAAFVQLDDNNILQTAHSLALPEHNIRAAFDWDSHQVCPTDEMFYLSQPFWIFNLGVAENINTQIVVDSGPDDWYFNYCDEDGNCFPGSMPMAHDIAAGDIKGFHLNITVLSSGIAKFRFVISGDGIGEYSIPFELRTSDMVNSDDPLIPASTLSLEANYPNPFSARTSIVINNPKSFASITVDIYNLKGQKVDSLVLDQPKNGINELIWKPENTLPAGVYLQKIRGSQQAARRMMLIK